MGECYLRYAFREYGIVNVGPKKEEVVNVGPKQEEFVNVGL
jgi:hypothetical protein